MQTSASTNADQVAQALNHGCYCRTLNPEKLRRELEQEPGMQGLMQSITQTRPHMFSATAVFLTAAMQQQMTDAVKAIERVIALPAYQAQALARAPAIAAHRFGPQGVCMGYDFHLTADGPRLIEINTNAGGLMLNAALVRAQESCCDAMRMAFASQFESGTLDGRLHDMFVSEWQRQRGTAPIGAVAIVDDDPANQYLAPEFEQFKQMLLRHGVTALVTDPAALQWHDGRLWHGSQEVGMVYNRLTDFYLEDPAHLALRQAYEAGAVVVTPDPHAHALYADKRNLIALSDNALLSAWGVAAQDRAVLQDAIPATQLVRASQADVLWAERKQLFFKPVAGYGAKAAYRGDKLTKGVWADILAGDFVAQALVPPGARLIEVDGVLSNLKFDVRAYTYGGEIQLLAARMYSGQTTNFRTAGGGFAPVIIVPSH